LWTAHLLRPEQVAGLEDTGPPPDIFTLGTAVMYQVFCDDGILAYARRFTDPT
jgi:hypothetical protein